MHGWLRGESLPIQRRSTILCLKSPPARAGSCLVGWPRHIPGHDPMSERERHPEHSWRAPGRGHAASDLSRLAPGGRARRAATSWPREASEEGGRCMSETQEMEDIIHSLAPTHSCIHSSIRPGAAVQSTHTRRRPAAPRPTPTHTSGQVRSGQVMPSQVRRQVGRQVPTCCAAATEQTGGGRRRIRRRKSKVAPLGAGPAAQAHTHTHTPDNFACIPSVTPDPTFLLVGM